MFLGFLRTTEAVYYILGLCRHSRLTKSSKACVRFNFKMICAGKFYKLSLKIWEISADLIHRQNFPAKGTIKLTLAQALLLLVKRGAGIMLSTSNYYGSCLRRRFKS